MNKKFPFFKVIQNNESFIMTKMNVAFLAEKVNFHFRSPYQENTPDFVNTENYIQKLSENLNIEVKDEEKGIQRRTDLKRIKDIANFIDKSHGIVFSTPIVLAFNIFSEEKDEKDFYILNEQTNEIEFSEGIEFTIIDGQHRLAGLVEAFKKTDNDLEMPITLIFNAGLSTATQLFIDINGNQRKVNRSMIYDLYENIDEEKMNEINKYTSVVRALNVKEKSPFYNRVKRLGTGTGTISQSFLVDYIKLALDKIDLSKADDQTIYSIIYIYFSIVRDTFIEQWEIESNIKDNSQLVKTNGTGALLLGLPKIIEQLGVRPDKNKEAFKEYFAKRKNFNWDNSRYNGTGKKTQNMIMRDFLDYNTSL